MLSAIHILYTYINTFVFRHPSASNRLSCTGCRHFLTHLNASRLQIVTCTYAWYVSRRYFLVLQFSFPINANTNGIVQRNCSCTRRININNLLIYLDTWDVYKRVSSTTGVRVVQSTRIIVEVECARVDKYRSLNKQQNQQPTPCVMAIYSEQHCVSNFHAESFWLINQSFRLECVHCTPVV
jgi:hypothetical protein